MRRIFLIIVMFVTLILITLILITSCGVNETVNINAVKNNNTSVTPMPTQPLVTTKVESKIILSEKDKENLGILIKWVYNSNLIHIGDDDSSIQLSDNINLLPSDQDKLDFIIALATYENLLEIDQMDSSSYYFTSDYADLIINYAVGERFNEHKAYEDIDYDNGSYYYSLAGADGAMWWPSIEIQSVSSDTEDTIKVKGILKSEHDIYTNVYSYDFEAFAIVNTESPFGGYTLKELFIK